LGRSGCLCRSGYARAVIQHRPEWRRRRSTEMREPGFEENPPTDPGQKEPGSSSAGGRRMGPFRQIILTSYNYPLSEARFQALNGISHAGLRNGPHAPPSAFVVHGSSLVPPLHARVMSRSRRPIMWRLMRRPRRERSGKTHPDRHLCRYGFKSRLDASDRPSPTCT